MEQKSLQAHSTSSWLHFQVLLETSSCFTSSKSSINSQQSTQPYKNFHQNHPKVHCSSYLSTCHCICNLNNLWKIWIKTIVVECKGLLINDRMSREETFQFALFLPSSFWVHRFAVSYPRSNAKTYFFTIGTLKAQHSPLRLLSFIIKNCLRAIDFMGGNHQVHQRDPLNFHENDCRKIKSQLLLRTMKSGVVGGSVRKGEERENYQAVVLRLCSMFISLRRFTVALDFPSFSPSSRLFFLFGES